VETDSKLLHARDYIDALAARGRYFFASSDAQKALGVSPIAAASALNRLSRRKLIASPARGFYVVIPPEHRPLGCLPAEQFIPDLMERLHLSYYVGLLSAAQYHGAAHHSPQELQVFLEKNRRPIHQGAVRVRFIARAGLPKVPVQSLNTPSGSFLVSSPEATAIDLVGYAHRAGGLGNVGTVLSELEEKIDPVKLAAVAPTAPVAWSQRLGFLLEHLGFPEKAAPLKDYVRQHAKDWATLSPKSSRARSHPNKGWKLHVNTKIESEA